MLLMIMMIMRLLMALINTLNSFMAITMKVSVRALKFTVRNIYTKLSYNTSSCDIMQQYGISLQRWGPGIVNQDDTCWCIQIIDGGYLIWTILNPLMARTAVAPKISQTYHEKSMQLIEICGVEINELVWLTCHKCRPRHFEIATPSDLGHLRARNPASWWLTSASQGEKKMRHSYHFGSFWAGSSGVDAVSTSIF